MIARFLRNFVLAAFATAILLVGLAAAAGSLLFREPPVRFEARGMSFVVPQGWTCQAEGTESVCRPRKGEPFERQAIIVATAKTIGPNDTDAFYKTYLTTPHRPAPRDGVEYPDSTVVYFRRSEVGGRDWAEALHKGSLLPSYYSRYLAATIGATAVLITLSFKDTVYDQQEAFMTDFVASIRVRGELGTGA